MKIRNKKTGEIVQLNGSIWRENNPGFLLDSYDSLKAFLEEYEDAPEEKDYWYIDEYGNVLLVEPGYTGALKEIGNYFETKEEAEQAVEKLKAWKRLRKAGFKFEGLIGTSDLPPKHNYIQYFAGREDRDIDEIYKDLRFLFEE